MKIKFRKVLNYYDVYIDGTTESLGKLVPLKGGRLYFYDRRKWKEHFGVAYQYRHEFDSKTHAKKYLARCVDVDTQAK